MLSYILGIKHLDAILSKQPGEHTLPFYLLAAEAAVIYKTAAARRAFLLKKRRLTAVFLRKTHGDVRALGILRRHVPALTAHDRTAATLARICLLYTSDAADER